MRTIDQGGGGGGVDIFGKISSLRVQKNQNQNHMNCKTKAIVAETNIKFDVTDQSQLEKTSPASES